LIFNQLRFNKIATGRGVLILSPSISANVFCTESVATGTGVIHH